MFCFVVWIEINQLRSVREHKVDTPKQISPQEYRVVTLNVNRLHNPLKINKLIAKMKREKQHVIFWQETHLSLKEHKKLK